MISLLPPIKQPHRYNTYRVLFKSVNTPSSTQSCSSVVNVSLTSEQTPSNNTHFTMAWQITGPSGVIYTHFKGNQQYLQVSELKWTGFAEASHQWLCQGIFLFVSLTLRTFPVSLLWAKDHSHPSTALCYQQLCVTSNRYDSYLPNWHNKMALVWHFSRTSNLTKQKELQYMNIKVHGREGVYRK